MNTIVYLFGSKRCAPCRYLMPTFQAWATKYRGKADFVVVHLDEDVRAAIRFGVTAVPTIVVLQNEQVVGKFVGAPREEEIARLLGATDNLPAPGNDAGRGG